MIRVSAVVARDAEGRVLTVRKRGTTRFMLPGGKPEPGETADQTAAREFAEELGVPIEASALRPLGTFRSAAANEADHLVEGAVFVLTEPWADGVRAAAEIEEVRWLDPAGPLPDDLAPLLEHRVLPALAGGERAPSTTF